MITDMNPEVASTNKAAAENFAAFVISIAGDTLITISSVLGFSSATTGRRYYF
ncbi:MAG TPA: hypothetical protein VFF30_01420 [Nitrososphaerales archaeon]|nr:hypothetical protein [Nitrososphaerales archaeon]